MNLSSIDPVLIALAANAVCFFALLIALIVFTLVVHRHLKRIERGASIFEELNREAEAADRRHQETARDLNERALRASRGEIDANDEPTFIG